MNFLSMTIEHEYLQNRTEQFHERQNDIIKAVHFESLGLKGSGVLFPYINDVRKFAQQFFDIVVAGAAG